MRIVVADGYYQIPRVWGKIDARGYRKISEQGVAMKLSKAFEDSHNFRRRLYILN